MLDFGSFERRRRDDKWVVGVPDVISIFLCVVMYMQLDVKTRYPNLNCLFSTKDPLKNAPNILHTCCNRGSISNVQMVAGCLISLFLASLLLLASISHYMDYHQPGLFQSFQLLKWASFWEFPEKMKKCFVLSFLFSISLSAKGGKGRVGKMLYCDQVRRVWCLFFSKLIAWSSFWAEGRGREKIKEKIFIAQLDVSGKRVWTGCCGLGKDVEMPASPYRSGLLIWVLMILLSHRLEYGLVCLFS